MPVPASRRRPCLVLAVLIAIAAVACTRPPTPTTARPPALISVERLDRSTAPPPDCDAPPVAHEPEGCRDDAARPPDAPPAERPGVDRDGDGVEDLLDVCPDQPAAPDTDADGDGCADGSGAATS